MPSEFLMHLKMLLSQLKHWTEKFKLTIYKRHVDYMRQRGKDVIGKTENNGSVDSKVDVNNKLNRFSLTLFWWY